MCLQGAARVAAALEGLPAGSLGTLIAWVPMLPPDTEAAAAVAARRFTGATHFWDGDRGLAAELARTLGITSTQSIGAPGGPGFAWDVYLAYGPGRTWDHRPGFWMHQLAVTRAPRLDPAEFRRRVDLLLRS